MISKDLSLEALRMFKRHLKVRGKNFTYIRGDAPTVAKTILKKLYNGRFMQTSLGNYPQFYARDFGMMLPALLELGYKEQAKKTLEYALKRYKKHKFITTHITPKGIPINFPNTFSPDSVAYILRSIILLNDKELIDKYKDFLQTQVYKFFHIALDSDGTIKKNTHFAGMRDHSVRNSSCYDTVMAAIVKECANKLKLQNPLKHFDYKSILLENYWNGEYFYDDIQNKTLTADANIYPFWLDIIKDKTMLKSVIKHIQENNLDKPFPIKYVANKKHKGKTLISEKLVSDWQGSAIWPMSGLPYIQLLLKIDKEKAIFHLTQYKRLIEKYGTFLEVYTSKGQPYKSLVFSTDEGMIWCALWLLMWGKYA